MRPSGGSRWSLAGVRAALQTQRAGGVVGFLGAVLFLFGAIALADRDAKLGADAPVAGATVVEVFQGRLLEN